MEDGSLVEKDLWIDERRGVVLDSQVCVKRGTYSPTNVFAFHPENVFPKKTTARQSHRYGGEHRQPRLHRHSDQRCLWVRLLRVRR